MMKYDAVCDLLGICFGLEICKAPEEEVMAMCQRLYDRRKVKEQGFQISKGDVLSTTCFQRVDSGVVKVLIHPKASEI